MEFTCPEYAVSHKILSTSYKYKILIDKNINSTNFLDTLRHMYVYC